MNSSPFRYDSKLMQGLALLADYMLLNFLYVLCCLPVFTIGAAQSGLYTALRVLTDENNDSSCFAAFFRGFRNGFLKITVLNTLLLFIILALGYNTLAVYVFHTAGFHFSTPALIVSIIAASLFMIYQTMLPLFHSRFDCSYGKLLRNVFLVIMAHPLRSFLSALLVWAPVILLIVHFGTFLYLALILVVLYYSVAMSLAVRMMKKPFQKLIDNFNEKLPAEAPDAPDEPGQ